jgi:prephenate dehydrogenase
MAVRFEDAHVTVVGLGLMGGSLAAALTGREACRRVTAVARRKETLTQALDMGIIHKGSTDLQRGVAEADVVVLATPVRTIVRHIESLGRWFPSGCLVTDVGSTKQAIVEAMAKLPPEIEAVGGHPMCGKEVAGLEAIDPELYSHATYVLTPLERTSDSALVLAREMVQAVGACPLMLNADRHDRLAAAVSHLPYLAAVGLVGAVRGLEDKGAWEMAASGFSDASRLAASDEKMMLDILLTNQVEVGTMLGRFIDQLAGLGRLVESGDEVGLSAAMRLAAQRRRLSQ